MLAGTYYFYKDGNLIKEIDIADLPDMDKNTFEQYALTVGADKAVRRGVYHGGQMNESEEVLYDNTKPKTMLSKECKTCKHVFWVVGIGQGVRCRHPENQKYKSEDDNQNIPVIISRIPSGCTFKVLKECKNEN